MRAWLCRRGWHAWDTWLWWTGKWFTVHKKCARAGCGAEEN